MTMKELRVSKGLSQMELAKIAKLQQSTISMYENGTRRPDMATAKKLADILGVTLDYFYSAVFQNEMHDCTTQ